MSMAWVAVGVIGGAVVGGVAGNALTNKASPAGLHTPLDIQGIIADARKNAEANLSNSLALEQKYLPGTASLRKSTDTALTDQLTGNTNTLKARDSLLPQLTDANPLLKESSTSILNQLKLGGKLDPETQNAVVRGALQAGGTAGITGSGAGRGLVARDLGLTSLNLLNQRQQAAQQAGSLLSSDLLSRSSALNAYSSADANRTLGISSLIDQRAMPESGLSANSIADLYVAENNAADKARLEEAKLKAAARQSKINAILGFASLGANIGGKVAGAKTG